MRCRCTAVATPSLGYGRVRLAGSGPTLVPACSIRVLEGSSRPLSGNPYSALVERIEVEVAELPKGLTVGVSLVMVDRSGLIPIQVANFSDQDAYLHPRMPVAVISRPVLETATKMKTMFVYVKPHPRA